MSGLVDTVLSHLDDAQVGAIASRLGVDPAQARTAIEHAVPLIVGHLAQNASTPQGADSLNNALGEHAGFRITDVLNGMLNSGGSKASAAPFSVTFSATTRTRRIRGWARSQDWDSRIPRSSWRSSRRS